MQKIGSSFKPQTLDWPRRELRSQRLVERLDCDRFCTMIRKKYKRAFVFYFRLSYVEPKGQWGRVVLLDDHFRSEGSSFVLARVSNIVLLCIVL